MIQKNDPIICLGAGISQLPLIQAVKHRGYSVVAIDRDSDAPGFSLADTKIIESTYDMEIVLDALHVLEKRHHFCGLVARTSGPALKTAAAIAEEFHLPGLNREIVPLATEKSKLREFCESHDILMPKGQKISQLKELDSNFPLPLILKPDLPLIGKKDIRVVWKSSDLESAVQAAIQSSGNGFAEVEEYIDGFDVACLFHIDKRNASIVCFWDELVGFKKNGEIFAMGVSAPSVVIRSQTEKKIRAIIESFALQLADINHLLILSFRVDMSGNPYIIELHADLGGDLIAEELLPMSDSSFNYFKYCINIATNSIHELAIPNLHPFAILFESEFLKENTINKHFIALSGEDLKDLHGKIFDSFDKKLFLSNVGYYNSTAS